MSTVTIYDETTAGERSDGWTLEFLTECVTVREIIRSRVYQEVTEHNARAMVGVRTWGLISDVEKRLNGELPKRAHRIDWQEKYRVAIDAFNRNGFLLFVDDRQLTDLDEEIELRHDATVTFLKLTPLVGG